MQEKKKLVLLVNLGSPNKLSVSAIRLFLAKFLSDRRVVNLPKILWHPILYGIILPFRAPKLFKLYSKIWHKSGVSPLIYYTKMQAEKLSERIQSTEIYYMDSSQVRSDRENLNDIGHINGASASANNDVIVLHAFCYSTPEIKNVLLDMHAKYEITNLTVVPLYPQFSSTTTLPVFDQVASFYKDKYYLPNIQLIRGFHANKEYINLIAKKIQASWASNGPADKLVLSFHSLPINIISKGDSYYDECLNTSKLIAEKLNLSESEYLVSFQSKFGRQKWLTPVTSTELINLAKDNMGVDIICPGFVSDCLETLEEINVTNRKLYMDNGGIKYTYIDCLNDDDEFITVLESIAKDL